jgi:hypothetical protein
VHFEDKFARAQAGIFDITANFRLEKGNSPPRFVNDCFTGAPLRLDVRLLELISCSFDPFNRWSDDLGRPFLTTSWSRVRS